jgi:hypothetical protein
MLSITHSAQENKMPKQISWLCFLILIGTVEVFAQQPQTRVQDQTSKASAEESTKQDIELLLLIKTAEAGAKLYVLAPDSNKDQAAATTKLAELYAKAVKSPRVMSLLLGEALSDFYDLKQGARGAAQVSQAADEAGIKFQSLALAQNQTIIEQNQRIIGLLEQLVRKR